jgi:hypothetical protein
VGGPRWAGIPAAQRAAGRGGQLQRRASPCGLPSRAPFRRRFHRRKGLVRPGQLGHCPLHDQQTGGTQLGEELPQGRQLSTAVPGHQADPSSGGGQHPPRSDHTVSVALHKAQAEQVICHSQSGRGTDPDPPRQAVAGSGYAAEEVEGVEVPSAEPSLGLRIDGLRAATSLPQQVDPEAQHPSAGGPRGADLLGSLREEGTARPDRRAGTALQAALRPGESLALDRSRWGSEFEGEGGGGRVHDCDHDPAMARCRSARVRRPRRCLQQVPCEMSPDRGSTVQGHHGTPGRQPSRASTFSSGSGAGGGPPALEAAAGH